MLTLAVDTSTPAVTAGVAEVDADGDVRLLSEQVLVNDRAHGEQLTPLIAAALAEAGGAPGDLKAIVAGRGPGPFTGLRAGLATATALGSALQIPTYGVGSLEAMAVETNVADEEVLVASDARRKEIYWILAATAAAGRRSGSSDDPKVNRPEELPPEARKAARAVGDGARKYADVLGLPVSDPLYPPAAGLLRLAAARVAGNAPGETLTPIYLRRPNVNIAGKQRRV
ncbi:MAG: tRNA (adenosine(37)-N6)-threonylcarbamoyltransferase complex dimerization subunit type 1 TsaB [Stackebrandtia sp.]